MTVVIQAGVALALALTGGLDWTHAIDWLTLPPVPLTPGIAVALACWYPTKEVE